MSTLQTDTGPRPLGTNVNLSFGYHPGYPGNAEHVHYGTDLRAADGDPDTYPENLTPGFVVVAGAFGGYGLAMVVRWIDAEGTRWYLLYGHMLRLFYGVGAWVQPGAVIGESDHSGFVVPSGPGGAHLHFAVGRESYYGGGWVDPEAWLIEYTTDPLEAFMASLTESQRAALMRFANLSVPQQNWLLQHATEQAADFEEWGRDFKGYLSPVGFAARDALFDSAHDPGTPNNHVAIGIRRQREAFQALQLTQDQIAALPVPKYETLKKWVIDLQEQAQEEPVGPANAGGVTPPVVPSP